jgi:hypothetical protein
MPGMTEPSSATRIVLRIPGPWESHEALAQAIAACNPHTVLSGNTLRRDDRSARVEIVEHDPDLRDAFAHAGRLFSETDLAAIAAHRSAAWLIGDGGSLEAGREMMEFADALLRAGGLAVKVETSGVAHRAQDWLAQSARKETHVGALFIAYVALVASRGGVYSCGMHNLGFPDAILSADLPPQRAGQLLKDFLMYLLHEQPALTDEHTFAVSGDEAKFKLARETRPLFAADDLFHNPYGWWRLTPLKVGPVSKPA